VARNHLPADIDIAYGEMRDGYPQIWASTLDRNAVWDAVAREHQGKSQKTAAKISSMAIDPDPADEWWKTGCPNCDNPELDVHLHGGLSCYKCGWDGDMLPGGQLWSTYPTEETANELWPDTIPWGEAEQDYYRHSSTPLTVNPVNYEFIPFTDAELVPPPSGAGKSSWHWNQRARRHNRRGRDSGAEGKVTGDELFALAQRFDFGCAYCGRQLDKSTASFDHVVPLWLGGTNTISNLLPTCHACNAGMDKWDQSLNPDLIADRVNWYQPPETMGLATASTGKMSVMSPKLGDVALAAIMTNDGFSLNLDGTPVDPGYYTSVAGHQRTIPLDSIIEEDIDNYIRDHLDTLKEPDNFLGAWVSDNLVFLDVSRSFQNEEEAQEFGAKNHQEAMWDGFNQREIPIHYDIL
jgi:5-methylcytosine-specific restriction endonuclease McrA